MIFFTFLRHGRTIADDENRFESRYDAELNAEGKEQAEKLADLWRTQDWRRYEVILSSPLTRAKTTAEILNTHYNVPLLENELLNELDAGELCGMLKDDARKQYPEKSFTTPYERIVNETGESEVQLHSRALLAIENIINMKKRSYLIVSHGMILNALIRNILGIPVPVNRCGAHFRFTDTAYIDAVYNEDIHQWTVLGFYS